MAPECGVEGGRTHVSPAPPPPRLPPSSPTSAGGGGLDVTALAHVLSAVLSQTVSPAPGLVAMQTQQQHRAHLGEGHEALHRVGQAVRLQHALQVQHAQKLVCTWC